MPKLRRDAGNLTMLRWASVPVTNRRWTAPLSAAALAMGLFVGVAISPRVDDTQGAPASVFAAAAPVEPVPALLPPSGGAAESSPGGDAAAEVPKPPKAPSIPDNPSTTPPVFPTPDLFTPSTPITPITPAEDTITETTTETSTTTTDEGTTTGALELAGTVAHVNPLARSYRSPTADGRLSADPREEPAEGGDEAQGAGPPARERDLRRGRPAQQEGHPRLRRGRGLVPWRDPGNSRFTISADGVSALVVADGSLTIPNVGALVVVTARIEPSPRRRTRVRRGRPSPQTTTTETPPTTTTTPDDDDDRSGDGRPSAPHRSRRPPGLRRRAAPARGAEVVLTATKIDVDTPFVGSGSAEGVVQGVCASNDELIISADDQRASEADVTLELPAGSEIDLDSLHPGDVVDVALTIDEQSKRLELTGVGRDEGAGEADDPALLQGG